MIGSAFQLLLLVYTAMAHKFAEKPVQKTALQLRHEADELEQVAMQQARIDAVKKMQNDSKVGGLIDSLGQAKERAKMLFGNGQSVNTEMFPPDVPSEPEKLHEGRTTDPLKDNNDVESDVEEVNEQNYVTDEMPKLTLVGNTKRVTKKPASTKQKIQKLLTQYPDATQSVIAQKAKVSRSYVSRISKESTATQ